MKSKGLLFLRSSLEVANFHLRMIVFGVFLILGLASCFNKEMSSVGNVEVIINIDWTESSLNSASDGATCIFYPQLGGEPVVVLMGDRHYEKTSLPKGQYDVLVFNRTFGDFASITFREEKSFESIEACLKQEYTRGLSLLTSPDELATATINNWLLGEETNTIQLTPRKITRQIKMKLRGKGLENVYSATGVLTAMPEGVRLADASISESVNMQLFNFSKTLTRTNGEVEYMLLATFDAFGFDEDVNRELHFTAQLRDGATVFEEKIVIETINKDHDFGDDVIYIELETPSLPEVAPGITSGSSFDVAVDKWGDEENNQIPV